MLLHLRKKLNERNKRLHLWKDSTCHLIAGGCWYTTCSYTSSNNSQVVVVANCGFARRDFQWLYHSFTVSLSTDCSLFKFGLLCWSSWLMLTGILAAWLVSSSGTGCCSDHPAVWRQESESRAHCLGAVMCWVTSQPLHTKHLLSHAFSRPWQ